MYNKYKCISHTGQWSLNKSLSQTSRFFITLAQTVREINVSYVIR